MLDFCPPKDSPAFIGFAKMIMPMLMKINGTSVQVVGDGMTRFKQIGRQRTVICPNHPNHDDPAILFTLAQLAGEDFNFLAAREVFEWNYGFRGVILQLLGCYSVVRGAPDRESFKTTKRLLVEGKKKLVIFPEGEISQQNDTLMALESGVAQMSFWAVDELQKNGVQEPVLILPITLKYTYRRDIQKQLGLALERLEHRLGIVKSPASTLYQRLRAVAEILLTAMESEYGCKPSSPMAMNERITHLKAFILKNAATFLNLSLPDNCNYLEWIRILRNHLDDFVYADESTNSPYEKRLHEQKMAQYKGFYRDLDRVVNFIAIYDGYLSERLSQERFADVIDRFETEVFGHSFVKGPRLVLVHIGESINLLQRYEQYRGQKRQTLEQINGELKQQISDALQSLNQQHQPLFVD